MSNQNEVVADHLSETYPQYGAKIQDTYLDGYDPVSYAAPHSSLLRSSTWIGMGALMGTLPPIGILIWGLGTYFFPEGSAGAQSGLMTTVGIASTLFVGIASILMIVYGRRFYRNYRAETGRVN